MSKQSKWSIKVNQLKIKHSKLLDQFHCSMDLVLCTDDKTWPIVHRVITWNYMTDDLITGRNEELLNCRQLLRDQMDSSPTFLLDPEAKSHIFQFISSV